MSTVYILGGGVAGLTAAHELAERGFDVVLFERHDICGGKARSMKNSAAGPNTCQESTGSASSPVSTGI